MVNLSQTLLGIWSLIIYTLVIIFAFVSIKIFAHVNNEIIGLWKRPCVENLCENWLDENYFSKSITNDEMNICLECGEKNCNQHDQGLFIYEQPWKHLLIDENLNTKLEDLFEFLLEKYTSPWLMNISYNPRSILLQFKQLIRLVASSLIIRVKNHINLDEIIMNKLPGHLIQHLEMYIHGKRNARSAHFLEECVLKQYGSIVHPAVINYENELKYFKSIANLIMHTTLPPKYIQCDISKSFLNEFIACCIINPLVDKLSDPDKINIIFIYLLDDRNKNYVHEKVNMKTTVNSKIHFLHRFRNDCDCEIQINDIGEKMPKNLFGVRLKQIFQNEHLLFLFTRFAREENFLNYLQFSMHMDSFLALIINPELRSDQLKKLHLNLKSIYDLYFLRESRDFIDFDDDTIYEGFHNVIEDSYENVDQFRNCKSLYEAYEFVNNVLDRNAQRFFQTESYMELICGHLNIDSNSEHLDLSNKKNEFDSSMMLQNVIDNQNMHYPGNNFESIDEMNNDNDDTESFSEDLTNWRVTIPHISVHFDDITNRENYYFEIHVQKLHSANDVDESSTLMINERQFNEFYTLESKLKEFHGEEIDAISLPPRRTFVRITKQLLETHREKFEKFLQQLLSNESMKRSRLFYNFLNSPKDTFAVNFNLTKMIRNVPSKFSKEKGQHLYSFLKNFINSCEKDPVTSNGQQQSPKKQQTKNSKNSNNQINNKRRKSFIVKWPEIVLTDNDDNHFDNKHHVSFKFLYDYILTILIRFYSLSNRLKFIFFLFRPIFRHTLQGFCHYQLRKKLKQTFTAINIVTMIDHLKESLKYDESIHDDDQNNDYINNHYKKINFPMNLTKNQRSELVLKLLKNFIPKWLLELFVDNEKHEEIVFIIFSLLQYRLLNKQLLYLIIDLLLNEMYPENLLKTIEYHHFYKK